MKKLKIGVLFGGLSAEHEVSIKSAISIIKNLNVAKYFIIPIYIDTDGKWHYINLNSLVNESEIDLAHHITKCINQIKCQENYNYNCIKPVDFNEINQSVDVLFPIIHGKTGEDGILQGFFELLDIPYVSSNILSSSITMDKEFTKMILKGSGTLVAPYISIKEYQYGNEEKKSNFIQYISQNFSYPLFVKPANGGSSIGIEKVKQFDDLVGSIENAFKYDNKILVEQGILGKEIEVSVLENIDDYDKPIISYPGELIPKDEFYSYKAKYIMKDGAKFQIPAILDDPIVNIIREKAGEIFKILECNCLARVDFFLETKSNRLFFSEINTLPGFTEISLYPKLLDHYGIKYKDLLDKLIALSLKKHKLSRLKNKNSIDILSSIKLN
ncbi:D-alanine--D-alanine ligase [Candidatus Bandiella numerosa]|uniref:D-alanine--D-alanine ligase family protein n=1 Tax=Candidatus Bandiella numerosa TaxID=2570586 RepID=UPI00249E499A|nr:D-alanine--D-alanine ligase family protein [Candidatus Bandiella numerosa]WHA05558.1 D-alanine--D-alanine ligase [Candidatus Bandiella numerosa]